MVFNPKDANYRELKTLQQVNEKLFHIAILPDSFLDKLNIQELADLITDFVRIPSKDRTRRGYINAIHRVQADVLSRYKDIGNVLNVIKGEPILDEN